MRSSAGRLRGGRASALIGLVLLCGFLGAGALAWSALRLRPDVDVLGRLEGVRAAEVLAASVQAALERILEMRTWSLPSAGPELGRGEPLAELRDWPNCSPETAAGALLAEAERVARRRDAASDSVAALELARDARAKAAGEACVALARSACVRLASRVGSTELERELPLLATDAPFEVLVEGRSPRMFALLAALPVLGAQEREAVRDELVGGAAAILALHRTSDTFVLEPGGESVSWRADPEFHALLSLLEADLPGITAELCASPAWATRVRALVSRTPREESPPPDRWRVLATPFLPLAERAGEPARFVAPRALASAIEREVEVPEGFLLDFGLAERQAQAEALAPARDLIPGVLTLTIRHSDPPALAFGARERERTVRRSLLALAALLALAGVLVALMLARERRLAELKAQFVAGVSHDLRTPLASILVMAENLELRKVGPERTAVYHATIRREAERLRRRVDDVLDFGRIDRGGAVVAAREATAPGPFLADLAQECTARATAAEVELAVRAPRLERELDVDADAVRRVVFNLLENALRHSGGKRIELEFDTAPGLELRIVLRDDGNGVAPEARERVFRPFERGRAADGDAKGGAGLGLTIVRALARAHGGEARVVAGLDGSSRRGFGVEVTFASVERETA